LGATSIRLQFSGEENRVATVVPELSPIAGVSVAEGCSSRTLGLALVPQAQKKARTKGKKEVIGITL